MEKAELQLTKESIAKEGIEIKINQSDVIDYIRFSKPAYPIGSKFSYSIS
jgi:hypothetical protein